MAYEGKYKDTFPIICAAGLQKKPNYTVEECLQHYSLEDGIQALKADFNVPVKETISYKAPKPTAINRHAGIYTEGRDLLRPPCPTRYATVINDLKESTYKSYWDKNLGKTVDPVPAFPKGTKVEELTFGEPHKFNEGVKDLIRPPKKRYEVLWESQIGHDQYKKIYGSYNPGEQIERGYKSPPYNANQCFGEVSGYDKRGMMAKCCQEGHNTSTVSPVNKIQSDFVERNCRQLGKSYEPNQVLKFLPKGHTFGAFSAKDVFGIEDLLRQPDTPVPSDIKDLRIWLVSWNNLKSILGKRIEPTFDYEVLYGRMRYLDQENTGCIMFGQFLEIMRYYDLFFNIANVKALLQYLKIVVDDRIDYKAFLNAVKGSLSLNKICDVPPEKTYYLTTYQDACFDSIFPDENVVRPTAGIPTRRHDERKTDNPFSDKYIQLSDYTDIKACLQPTIFTQYSLSHRDFFCPRDELFIKTLFRNVGYNIDEENFAKLWKMASEKDDTGKVCVQSFRDLLNVYYPLQKKLTVDEVSCY